MARSVAAQALLDSLDAELAANAAKANTRLEWLAAERAVLQAIADHVDRREELAELYDGCGADQVRTKIALATEIRLIESGVTRLVGQLVTDGLRR